MLMTMVPLVGPLTGVVVTTSGVPSGSVSPASVKSPPTVGVSSVVVLVSLSTIGASFTAVTVKVMSAVSHNTGVPASHNVYGNAATPLKFNAGSKVTTPVVTS